MTVELQGEFIQVVTQKREPLGALNDAIKIVAMGNPETAAVSRFVGRVLEDFNATKLESDELSGKLVMVARDKQHLASFARAAQQFLHYIVVCLRPEPAPAKLPSVHNVTHQVEVLAGVDFKKFQQGVRLATRCTQVNVRNKNSSNLVAAPVFVRVSVDRSKARHALPLTRHCVKGASHH